MATERVKENGKSKGPGWVCVWERVARQVGFVLVHDGQRNPGQFKLAPEDVRYYTKKYRWRIDGQFVNTWLTFVYDMRKGEVDVEVSYKEPKSQRTRRETMVLKEVLNGKH